ncbi:MAG: bifunctional adenosylcobinamide kinase/adenosylcobinamide-phosphate guanylyltransferase [Pikeienuella sp.]
MAHVSLVLGGARSGKSAHALSLVSAPRVFVATAEAGDGEMADRIAAHQAERGKDWTLIEAPVDLVGALAAAKGQNVLIDCMTLWLSNLMHHEHDCAVETANLIAALQAAQGAVVLVSNEVGMGLAPMNALGRAFRDEQGRLNQRIAAMADRVEFVAAGLPLRLK